MKKIKISSKKIATILVVSFVIIIGGVGYYFKNHKANPPKTDNESGEVNLQPATKEDKKRADDNKQRIIEKDEQLKKQGQRNSSAGKQAVAPAITYAEQYGANIEVGAYVGGVFEDGGTCTATFSKVGASFSKTTTGVKNVSSVNCPTMIIPTSAFSTKGAWSVVVSYSSNTSSGSSAPKQIEVK